MGLLYPNASVASKEPFPMLTIKAFTKLTEFLVEEVVGETDDGFRETIRVDESGADYGIQHVVEHLIGEHLVPLVAVVLHKEGITSLLKQALTDTGLSRSLGIN